MSVKINAFDADEVIASIVVGAGLATLCSIAGVCVGMVAGMLVLSPVVATVAKVAGSVTAGVVIVVTMERYRRRQRALVAGRVTAADDRAPVDLQRLSESAELADEQARSVPKPDPAAPVRFAARIGVPSTGDPAGSFLALLRWGDSPPAAITFELFLAVTTEVASTGEGQKVLYEPRAGIDHPVSDLADAQPVVSGEVRECGDIDFDIATDNLSTREQLHALFTAIERTRELCAGHMRKDSSISVEYAS